MSDLSALLKEILVPEICHVDMIQRTGIGTLQWFLENDYGTHPIHNHNHLEFLMCGEQGFAAIERDIRAATSTIDLVLWGFDPGMELVRQPANLGGESPWPRGTPFGDLLTHKAREGVRVRMLLWYDNTLINKGAGNVPDFALDWLPAVPRAGSGSSVVAPTRAWLQAHGGGRDKGGPPSREQLRQIRATYCQAWWGAALNARFPNLEVRLRKVSLADVSANVQQYLPGRQDLLEALAIHFAATHHQKPVLIDYERAPGKTPRTCGYVMGLNSVTEYWDSTAHLYNDPRREIDWSKGAAHTRAWRTKPYRDYAIRVQGEALYNLNENFVQGWDSAQPASVGGLGMAMSAHFKPAGSLKAQRQGIAPADIPRPRVAGQRVQIVRTQPELRDATILKAYTLASSNAINYIFIENQYFQFPEWPRLIRCVRERACELMHKTGAKPAQLPPLHLFIVIPQPEWAQMLPRTYETIAQLGAGAGMAHYDRQVQGARKQDADKQEADRALPGFGPGATPQEVQAYERGLDLGGPHAIVRESAQAVPVNVHEQLQALGIKPLLAMLMSFDGKGEARHIRVRQRDNDAQQAQAAREARASAQGRARDVEPGNASDTNIVPRAYREIYIHSKLMFVDDVYTTLGSANLNVRSMVGDSELNISVAEYGFTRDARRRVWANLAGEDLDGGDGSREAVAKTHEDWNKRMSRNKDSRKPEKPPENGSFIHPFEDPRGVPLFRLA